MLYKEMSHSILGILFVNLIIGTLADVMAWTFIKPCLAVNFSAKFSIIEIAGKSSPVSWSLKLENNKNILENSTLTHLEIIDN